MVGVQLEERLLQTTEVRGSNRVISKIYIEQLCTVKCIKNTKIKKKAPEMAQF